MPRRRRRKPPVGGVSRAQKRLGEQNETLFPTLPNVYAGSTALTTVSFCSPRLSHFARSPTVGNAVPPLLAFAVGNEIRNKIFGKKRIPLRKALLKMRQTHLFPELFQH